MTDKATNKFRDAIAKQASAQMRKLMIALHKRILTVTAMNTGRTLGSWVGSIGTAVIKDIADDLGDTRFKYTGPPPLTASVSIGSEPGRQFYENYSLNTTLKLKFPKTTPYTTYYVSNGARLDSGYGVAGMSELPSGLDQGAGSRAFYQEMGVIASYDYYHDESGVFTPRSAGNIRLAVQWLKLNAKSIMSSK